jgi:hypothetical protein
MDRPQLGNGDGPLVTGALYVRRGDACARERVKRSRRHTM